MEGLRFLLDQLLSDCFIFGRTEACCSELSAKSILHLAVFPLNNSKDVAEHLDHVVPPLQDVEVHNNLQTLAVDLVVVHQPQQHLLQGVVLSRHMGQAEQFLIELGF